MKRFFLVDCNNFYVSCERVFNPTLYNKPVVVLGSNDACVIARSNEAKALGIAMGVPAFECEALFKKHKVIVYSANFPLYGDMSARVMQTVAEYATDFEIYSVDEAFFSVSKFSRSANPVVYSLYGQFIRSQVKKKTGIPVSIGIGSTKTLAKIANKLAKKNPIYNGVYDITDCSQIDQILETIDVADIWGIGYRYTKLLKSYQIFNARDFKYANDKWVKKNMTVVGLKTMLELRGISCLPLIECPEPKQSIAVSRSFGKKVTNLPLLKEALASYVSCAAEKLRKQNSVASVITVYAVTNRYHDPFNYFKSTHCRLDFATSYTPHLIAAANYCLEDIFQTGLCYKKVGIIFTDLASKDCLQMSTYASPNISDMKKQTRFIKVIDCINDKWGRNKLFFASSGIEQPWKMKQLKKSACFTTNWHELLTITI